MIGLRLKLWLAAAGAFLVALLGAFTKGRKSANDKHKAEKADAALDTHKRIDAVRPVDPDGDDIVNRLREHEGK